MSKEESWMKVAFLMVLLLLPGVQEGYSQHCFNLCNPCDGAVLAQDGLKSAGFLNGIVKRAREAELNSTLQNSDSVSIGDILLLNLFPQRFYKTVIDKIETDTNEAFLVRSRVAGTSFGFCLVSSLKGTTQLVVDITEKY
jgi:hypothetical protein